jgi:flagellar L-ring protein precursor FlgH
MIKRICTVAAVTYCASGAVLAQTTPATPTPAPAKEQKAINQPTNNNTAATISQRMQSNGGSLFRASMEAAPEPGQATLRDVSLIAVPDPVPHVLKKHDLITVIVREESAFKSDGTTDVKRQADIDTKLDAFIKLSLSNWEAKGLTANNLPEVKGEGTRDFKGTGEVDRTDSLTARIAVEVLDVKPNGTLVLQGSKRIKTDDEEQQFILTGICRATDVGADNTILSTNLFDLSLEKKHSGAVRDATKRGWAEKLLDLINPF